MIGKMIANYRILEKLGEGGMGVVYKAEDTKLNRCVALKFLPTNLTADAEAKKRFIHEARTASALDHPNICTIHEINETHDGQLFIVMACYDEESLKQKIERAPLNSAEAIDLALQVAEGLKKAHSRGIIHRDIKPSNIMFTSDGIVKIVDFGLAKLTRGQRLTGDGKTMGTIAYMSPEQTRGDDVDERSDIWALGVVLYEMLTGKLPFRGEYEQAIIYSIVNEKPEPFSKFIPELNESFQQILDKMLSKKLEARYQKTADLIADLKRLKDGVDSGIVLKNLSQKRKRKLYGITCSIALIVVLIFLALSGLFKSNVLKQENVSAKRIAVLPFIVRGGEDLAYLQNGMVDLLSIMLDGAGGLKRVDPYALQSYVSREVSGAIDPESGLTIAEHFGADLYLIGSVHGVGEQVQLSASLYDVKSGLKHNFETKRLEKTKIDKLVDDLATQLVVTQDEVAANQFKTVASATTTSYAALKAYLDGENYIRSEKYVPACQAFLRAVEADSTFALAYYRLEFAQQYTDDNFINRLAAIERALRHTEKLSWWNITLLNAKRLHIQKKFKASLQLYRSVTNYYPDNAEAWFYLGAFDIHWGYQLGYPIEDTRFALNKSFALNPDQPMAVAYLGVTYLFEGRYEESISFNEQRKKMTPEGAFTDPRKITPEEAYLKGDTLLARQIIREEMNSPSFNIWLSAKFNSCAELFDCAQNRISLLFEPGRSLDYQVEGYLSLAHINFAQGKIKAAFDEIERARDLDATFPLVIFSLLKITPMMEISGAEIKQEIKRTTQLKPRSYLTKIARLYALSLLHAQSTDYSKALAYVDSLQALTSHLQRLHADTAFVVMARDRAHTVLAKVYFEQGKLEQAWQELEQMEIECWMENHPMVTIFASLAYERYLRAQILQSQGRYEDAIRWLTTLGYVDQCEISYKAARNFLLAEIYEATKQPQKAIEHYNHFIVLWQNCDPELQPKVAEAKRRLERLEK